MRLRDRAQLELMLAPYLSGLVVLVIVPAATNSSQDQLGVGSGTPLAVTRSTL